MKRVRSATIDGKRHRIAWRPLGEEGALGLAHPDQCLIEIDPSLDNALTAEVLVHEALHRMLPHTTEEQVDRMASEITTILQRAELIAEDD